MAHVQAQAQPGVVHLAGNVRQQPGFRLHDVFQGDGHIRRQLRQKLPPKENRLLHVPLRKVHLGHEAPVDHQLPDAQVPGQGDGLAVPPAVTCRTRGSMAQGHSSAKGAWSQKR